MLRRSLTQHNTSKVVETVRKHCYKTWSAQKGWAPLEIVRADGCCLYDPSGREYLDLSAALVCVNIGYNNKAVNEALAKQATELSYVGPGMATQIRAECCEKLLEVVPKGIDKFFFPTAGTAANEAAVKIARFVTGKHKIISRYNSYHGATCDSLALTSEYRRHYSEKHRLISTEGHIYIPEYNSYRPGPLGLEADKHMEYLEYILENEPDVAAVIMEPIVGSNGVLIPPPDYWPKMRALTKKYNVLLIADEVMAAWGRAGEWFAVDKWGVTPDIITTAKGITNVVTPLGMVGTTREIADHFETEWFCHGHTYESHPITMATTVASIKEYQRLGLIERSRVEGAKFGAKLRTLMDKHPSVGDVRGTGFFWAVDCVKNRTTKERFATDRTKMAKQTTVIDHMTAALQSKHGITCFSVQSHIMCCPPLIINEQQMDRAVAALDDVLQMADAQTTN